MNRIFAVAGLLACLGTTPARATPPLPPPSAPLVCTEWTLFGPGSGFPTRRVNALAAGDGVVWAGTDFGLAHSTREGWRRVGTGDGLPSEQVQDLALAPNGVLWVATAAGLASVTPGRVDAYRARDSALPSDMVYAVRAGRDQVWVATAGGAARLRPATGTWTVWEAGQHGLPLGGVVALDVAAGQLFAAPAPGGLLVARLPGRAWVAAGQGAQALGLSSEPVEALLAVPARGGPTGEDPVWVGGPWGLARLHAAGARRVHASPVASGGLHHSDGVVYSAGPGGLIAFAGTHIFRYRAGPAGPKLLLSGRSQSAGTQVALRSSVPSSPLSAVVVASGALWVATGEGLGWCQPTDADRRLAGEVMAGPPFEGAADSIASAPREPPQGRARRGRRRTARVGVLLPAPGAAAPTWLPGLRAALQPTGDEAPSLTLEPPARPLRSWPGMVGGQAARLLFDRRVELLVSPAKGLPLPELAPLLARARIPLVVVGLPAPPAGERSSHWIVSTPGAPADATGQAVGAWIGRVWAATSRRGGGADLATRLRAEPLLPPAEAVSSDGASSADGPVPPRLP